MSTHRPSEHPRELRTLMMSSKTASNAPGKHPETLSARIPRNSPRCIPLRAALVATLSLGRALAHRTALRAQRSAAQRRSAGTCGAPAGCGARSLATGQAPRDAPGTHLAQRDCAAQAVRVEARPVVTLHQRAQRRAGLVAAKGRQRDGRVPREPPRGEVARRGTQQPRGLDGGRLTGEHARDDGRARRELRLARACAERAPGAAQPCAARDARGAHARRKRAARGAQ